MNDNSNFQPANFPPKTSSVFKSLRKGKHISRHQGDDYYDLERHHKQYTNIFNALGYKLVQHEQGFYYFTGDSVLKTQRMRGVMLFILILFQDLEDNKFIDGHGAWERTLLSKSFIISQLPHFDTPQRRTLMQSQGITPENFNRQPLGFMSQLGIIEIHNNSSFHFLPPIYRFVDLFLEFSNDDHWNRLTEHSGNNDLTSNIDALLEEDNIDTEDSNE